MHSLLKTIVKGIFFPVLAFAALRPSYALPELEKPVPLPADFKEIITILPDSENTHAIRRYWILPSTMRIVRKPTGDLAFGLIHSGVTKLSTGGVDPDGVSALLTATVQPYIDEKTLQTAKALITEQDVANGATQVSFSFIVPIKTTFRVLVGGQYLDWNGARAATSNGGTVEAGFPFQVKVTGKDVRPLAQAGGKSDAFGVEADMVFQGRGKKYHFAIEASYKQCLEHFKSRVEGSAYWGALKADIRTEWTNFKDEPFAKIYYYPDNTATVAEVDAYMAEHGAKKLFDQLLSDMGQQSGMFARTVKPTDLPDAPGGGLSGWGLSVGGGYESNTSTTNLKVEFDLADVRDQALRFGMSFGPSNPELRQYVTNLSDNSKPFPTSDDLANTVVEHGKCLTANLKALKSLFDAGLIPQDRYLTLVDDAIQKGCFVHYEPVEKFKDFSLRKTGGVFEPKSDAPGTRIPLELYLDFLSTRGY